MSEGIFSVYHMAELLNGRQYRDETTPELEKRARRAGFVIIFGASDDLVEIRGAIDDEAGAPGTFCLDRLGIIPSERDDGWTDEEMEQWFARKGSLGAVTVQSCWNEPGAPPWIYRTLERHGEFTIMEAGKVYCIGIVVEIPEGAAQ